MAAMLETILGLEVLGHKIVPSGQKVLALLPVFVLAFLARLFLNSRMGRAAGTHAE